jgi:hypothetical protein
MSRGKIRILEADALQDGACECYGSVRRHYARLLGPTVLNFRFSSIKPTSADRRGSSISDHTRNLNHLSSHDLVGPDFEAYQCVWAERLRDRDIRSIATLRDQDATDSRHVVTWIESAPMPADIGFKPAGEISHRPWLRRADVAEIPGAIARGNVHAAAERDGKMGIVAADALAFLISLPRRFAGACVLVSESDVMVDESQIACTRPQPGAVFWNNCQAISESRSVSQ